MASTPGRPAPRTAAGTATRTDEGPEATGPRTASELLLTTTGRLTMLVGLFWDVGLSLVGYYGLRLLGTSEWVALLGGAAAAALRVVWVALRERRLNAFASVMLLVFGLGVLFAVIGGNDRFLLLKDSVTTGSIGLAFLLTTALGRPLTLRAIQSWQPAHAAAIEEMYDQRSLAKRGFRLSAWVWGTALVGEALVRVPLVLLLPVDVVVGLSAVLMVTVIVSVVLWNGWYIQRMAHLLDEVEEEEPRR